MFKINDLIKNLLKSSGPSGGRSFKELFELFREILTLNSAILDQISEANQTLGGDFVFDKHFIETFVEDLSTNVQKLIFALNEMVPVKYDGLIDAYKKIESDIRAILEGRYIGVEKYILFYDEIKKWDEDSVGSKNAFLCQLQPNLNFKIPQGFAITFYAYHQFLAKQGLLAKIKEILNSMDKGECSFQGASKMIQNEILKARIPHDLKHDIKEAVARLKKQLEKSPLLAIRSSAYGEDSEHSFAGLYDTVLGVDEHGILDAYKRVIASTFNANALEYRKKIGFKEDETLMAVGCQELINSQVSGIVYSLNPVDPASDTLIVSSTWGIGGLIVSGRETGDTFFINRKNRKINSVQISWKTYKQKLIGKNKIETVEVDENLRAKPSLTVEQVKNIAECALEIERYFKKPQDIEFAITNGELVILQARPLKIKTGPNLHTKDLASLEQRYNVLIRDQGVTAQEGVGIGEVYVLRQGEDLSNVPAGAILVTKFASPRLAPLIPKISGLITEIGAVTGHLATICREYILPTLFNVSGAISTLKNEGLVTLDATDRRVYRGEVKELFFFNLEQEKIAESYEYRLLRRILRKIEPLNLIDPTDKNFRPENCETFHDITRFVHEKAVETLVNLHFSGINTKDASIKRLKWDIPLDLVIIDVGGGLVGESQIDSTTVTPEHIQSIPMKAMIEGLKCPGAWDSTPVSIDVSSFMSSLTRTFSAEHTDPKALGQNLAVISKHYANLSLRLGYHFTMVDAYVSKNITENYIYFRFFGGVTETERRNRRARMIREVLSHYDFMVDTRGDLVIGRIKRLNQEEMEKRLYLIGILIGFTRQLDVMMTNDVCIFEFKNKICQLMETKNE